MFKTGDILRNKQNGLLWRVGYICVKDGEMELFPYNPKPVMYPRFGSVVVHNLDGYELA